jgi:hypothetical protein
MDIYRYRKRIHLIAVALRRRSSRLCLRAGERSLQQSWGALRLVLASAFGARGGCTRDERPSVECCCLLLSAFLLLAAVHLAAFCLPLPNPKPEKAFSYPKTGPLSRGKQNRILRVPTQGLKG